MRCEFSNTTLDSKTKVTEETYVPADTGGRPGYGRTPAVER